MEKRPIRGLRLQRAVLADRQYDVFTGACADCSKREHDTLDKLANIMLAAPTYNQYAACADLSAKKKFLVDWYAEANSGTKKVNSALRLFDSGIAISYPEYLTRAVAFGA